MAKFKRHYGSPLERFRAYVRIEPNGCWFWLGYKNPLGYGRFNVEGKTPLAHRWAYEYYVGPIPEGLELDHLCRNPSCVNPDHLEAVTHKENMHRGNRWIPKTHCKRGHGFTPDNTYLRYGYQQICLTCQREAGRRYRLRKKQSLDLRGRKN